MGDHLALLHYAAHHAYTLAPLEREAARLCASEYALHVSDPAAREDRRVACDSWPHALRMARVLCAHSAQARCRWCQNTPVPPAPADPPRLACPTQPLEIPPAPSILRPREPGPTGLPCCEHAP